MRSSLKNSGPRFEEAVKPSGFETFLKVSAGLIVALIVVGAIAGYFYWSSLKGSPQYSLALLIEAARTNDQQKVAELFDVDAAVDDFVPQVVRKAADLYGRGVPKDIVDKIENLAAPLMPAVKARARDGLPKLIKKKTKAFESVPFEALVLAADRYLLISTSGDDAVVTSKLPEHRFEIRMRRNGTHWQVVAVKDDSLANSIARRIGQDVIAIATDRATSGSRSVNFEDAQRVLRQAQELFK